MLTLLTFALEGSLLCAENVVVWASVRLNVSHDLLNNKDLPRVTRVADCLH